MTAPNEHTDSARAADGSQEQANAEAIRARLELIDGAPLSEDWIITREQIDGTFVFGTEHYGNIGIVWNMLNARNNTEFIAHAPQDIRALLADRDRLLATVAKVYVAEQNNYTYGVIVGVFHSLESAASIFGLTPNDFRYHELGKSYFYLRPDHGRDHEYGNATIYELEFGSLLFPAESFAHQPTSTGTPDADSVDGSGVTE